MSTLLIGLKTGIFYLHEKTWKCKTCLESDVLIEVKGFSFCLHKFPLIYHSPVLKKLITESSCDEIRLCTCALHDIPNGASSFEFVAKFCYGEKIELTSSNVVPLLCAAYYLDMTEDYMKGNLISQLEIFLSERILSNWGDTIVALHSCEPVLHYAEKLDITSACLESLAYKALYGKSYYLHPQQQMHWNGIGYMDEAPPKLVGSGSSLDWWFHDISSLSLHLFKRFIGALDSMGHDPVVISNAVIYYADKYHTKLNSNSTGNWPIDQRMLLEEIVSLLPVQKGVTSTKFLFSVLNTSIMLNANVKFIQSLEKRIGTQLDESTMEDLFVPNLGYAKEVYDANCIQRIIEQFVKENFNVSEIACNSANKECLTEADSKLLAALIKLLDGYLLNVADDRNLNFQQFLSLANAIPMGLRHCDDDLYLAINSYIECHPQLSDQQKERLCQLIDIQSLSEDVCREVVQNEKLPLRVMVKALFFEMHHLKSSLIELESDNRIQMVVGPETENVMESVEGRDLMVRCVQLKKECAELKKEMKRIKKAKNVKKTSITCGSFFVKRFFSGRVIKALLAAPKVGNRIAN
ncbi:BTB/POZ domain-containing protein [Rhynchospora pubera]|uniref:BTB/POZ domain-containing protein n=1 Tax=Rhynchospora pubera TaxID=906938 RepID=A0AAV8BQS1_9POAL|nr:BTB/POZ domain-containing protein [Rhynchospora pubera]